MTTDSTPDAWIYEEKAMDDLIARDKQNERELVKERAERPSRKVGDPLPGYQPLSVMSSISTIDVAAMLPPMSEDELVHALYTDDFLWFAEQNLKGRKAKRKALDESEVKVTFLLRDLQRCESFDEFRLEHLLPAMENIFETDISLKERLEEPFWSLWMAHSNFYVKLFETRQAAAKIKKETV
jgi:hypothetical protein